MFAGAVFAGAVVVSPAAGGDIGAEPGVTYEPIGEPYGIVLKTGTGKSSQVSQ